MDYSNINNYLQNLELSNLETEKKFQNKINSDNCNIYKKEDLMKDNQNKDLLLQRELLLNNNTNCNFQIANPQRFFEKSESKVNTNNKINNYTFNNNFKNEKLIIDNRLNGFNKNSRFEKKR